MAKRQRANIKAALAAASGVESEDAQIAAEEAGMVERPETTLPQEVVLERGGEKRKKKSPGDSKGHQRTSTGYVKTDGQEVVRLTLHMSAEQKRNFKIKMITSGFDNPSSFVIESLNLNEPD